MTPLWQILIASVWSRTDQLALLLGDLSRQAVAVASVGAPISVLVDRDDCDRPVGEKRTRLVEAATAEYVCFVDDDDEVSAFYVMSILEALAQRPDAVGFTLAYSRDGVTQKPAVHSRRVERWREDEHAFWRTINHLNPVRRELALRCMPFEPGFGEDQAYAYRLAPLLTDEVFLDGPPVYHYRYSTSGSLFGGGPKRLGWEPLLPPFPHVEVLPC